LRLLTPCLHGGARRRGPTGPGLKRSNALQNLRARRAQRWIPMTQALRVDTPDISQLEERLRTSLRPARVRLAIGNPLLLLAAPRARPDARAHPRAARARPGRGPRAEEGARRGAAPHRRRGAPRPRGRTTSAVDGGAASLTRYGVGRAAARTAARGRGRGRRTALR